MNQPGAEPAESSIHVPPVPNTSALLSSTWTAREYNGRHASQKRRACNECRQQKLRCDLANGAEGSIGQCSRCVKLNLDCKVDESFQRTRKRKRSLDFQEEITSLKKQLEQYQQNAPSSQSPYENGPGDETPDRSAPGRLSGSPAANRASAGITQRTPSLVNNGLLPLADSADSSPDTERNHLTGTTTRPHEHELEAPPKLDTSPIAKPRSLGHGNVTLAADEIEELYTTFFSLYHGSLPILDPDIPAQQYAESSPLLFWCIMAVAARRSPDNPTLLSKLSQPVTDLLWKAIRSVPHSLALVQSILLICTWPFPTSSSATDPSYVLMHTAVSASIQIGLHRPQHQQDFAKYRVRLTEKEVAIRVRIWTACNIVAQSVSIGVGLQSPAHLQDWSSIEPLSRRVSPFPETISNLLQIELFRNKVTTALANNPESDLMTKPTHERLPLYKLLNSDWLVLEATMAKVNDLVRFHLLAARLHLHAFYLFDEAISSGYIERILALFATASSLIEHTLNFDLEGTGFTPYCSFYAYQSFMCAAFVLLKVLRSEYYTDLTSQTVTTTKRLFNSSITALRKMSVSNNDLPGRLSDVLAYLYNHPNPRVVCSDGEGALQLGIQSRLSMSIVYDSLWRWRDQFNTSTASTNGAPMQPNDAEFQAAMQDLPPLFQFDEMSGFPSDDLYFDWFR